MKNLKPIVTYIMDGKEYTKEINVFNYYQIQNRLFERNIFDGYTLFLKSNVEFVKFYNMKFVFSKFYINPNSKVVFDNCMFNNCLLSICKNEDRFGSVDDNSKVEFLNPHTNKYLGIRGEFINDLSIVLEEKISYKLIISGNVDKFFLQGDLNGSEIRLDIKEAYFNNVSNIYSLSLNYRNYIDNNIMLEDSITINDSEISLNYRGYCDFDQINTSNLILNNSVVFKEKSCGEFCDLKIRAGVLRGRNFKIKVPNDIEIGEDIYKKKKTDEYLFLTDNYFNDKKNQLIRNLNSILKGIKNNIENNIYLETKSVQENYEKKILRQQILIEETKKKSQNKVRKLERNLKNKNIGSYFS